MVLPPEGVYVGGGAILYPKYQILIGAFKYNKVKGGWMKLRRKRGAP